MSRFKLPNLPYQVDALEPYIDRRTMELHHRKHHAGYIKGLNLALEEAPSLAGVALENLLRELDGVPEQLRETVRNNGGGHFNHSLFWSVMSPVPAHPEPEGALEQAIVRDFESFARFRKLFTSAALERFGSGWAWLSSRDGKRLTIHSTANQDCPLMEGYTPILGLDVWEHAYYLNYENERGRYIDAWWHIVDWKPVAKRFAGLRAG